MGVPANRRRLHAHERRTAAALAAAYGTHLSVREHAAAIPVEAQPTDPRLTSAVFAFATSLAGFRLTARQIITTAQQVAAEQGRADAQALTGSITDDGMTMQDGGEDSGMANAVEQIAQDGPRRLAGALLSRLGLGGYSGAAAQAIGAVLGAVLLASRQAIIDAYRAAQAAVFRSAPDVQGWVWTSALAPNTCGFCYAMHGTWHPDTEDLVSHQYCQCVQVPTSLSAAEYEASEPLLGTDIFNALDAGAQRAILGPGRYAIYAAGTPLRGMIGERGMLPLHRLRRSA